MRVPRAIYGINSSECPVFGTQPGSLNQKCNSCCKTSRSPFSSPHRFIILQLCTPLCSFSLVKNKTNDDHRHNHHPQSRYKAKKVRVTMKASKRKEEKRSC